MRPGWATLAELTIAAIAVPEGSILSLEELGLQLPTNWNVRPAGPNAQRIGGEFLKAVGPLNDQHHGLQCFARSTSEKEV